ncbi:MAG TPA: type II secretion system protein [Holophagaceae bacterium]|jgi:prepilin-type N-terminal cleavage/methylation domain-containing protein|nr:type II secretion system protein [Holophagaceae bacterium]
MFDLRMRREKGFSLVELLLVLAIIGIITGIAIPAFMGQRKRARVIGDAQTNAQSLAMQLEARKAETGLYLGGASAGGGAITACTWTKGVPSASAFLPGVQFKGATQMNMAVTVTSGGLKYLITVTDPYQSSAQVLTRDQSGAVVMSSVYNK